MDNILVAKRLKELRKNANLSHKKLSDKLAETGITVSDKMLMNYEAAAKQEESGFAYSKSETIKGMKLETAVGIAKFFNVSLDYLVGNASAPYTNTNLSAVCEYTGMNKEEIDFFVNAKNELGRSVLTYLLVDNKKVLRSLCNYLLADSYRKATETQIPLKHDTKSYKIFFANLIEQLPIAKEDFEEKHKSLEDDFIFKYLLKMADISKCESIISEYEYSMNLNEYDSSSSENFAIPSDYEPCQEEIEEEQRKENQINAIRDFLERYNSQKE